MKSEKNSAGTGAGYSAGIALAALALLILSPAPCDAAGRVPTLEGPSVIVDFEETFLDAWLAAPPDDFQRVLVPRIEGAGAGEAAGEAAWEAATVLGPLVRPEPETEFRAFYNDEGLFLRARNRFNPENPPRAQMRPRNRWVAGEDIIEIRLREPAQLPGQARYRPGAAESPLFHFIVNAAGAIYDARDGETAHDPEWFREVEVGEESWTAWVTIPFAALELPGPVPELEINIGRGGDETVGFLSWGPSWGATEHRRIVLEGAPERQAAPDISGEEERAEPHGASSLRSGRGISLEWVSGAARPQERWIEGAVLVDGDFAGAGAELAISLRALGGDSPVETVRVNPDRSRGRIRVDPRRWGMEAAEVEARLTVDGAAVGMAKSLLGIKPLPPVPDEGFRIPLLVSVPEGPAPEGPWPLHAGVPFPAGILWEAAGWVVEDGEGNAFPTQLEVSGRWAREGSVQWLRVETVADPRAALFLVHRPGAAPPPPAEAVRVLERDGQLVLASGDTEYVVSAALSPVLAVRDRGRAVAGAAGTRGLYLVDNAGRTASASAEGASIEVESTGPVAACVRIEGNYTTEEGEALARHITRIELFAGAAPARITHTLVITRDTNETWFREVGWEMALAPGAEPEAFFGISRQDPAARHRLDASAPARIVQESYYRFGAGEKRFRLFSGPDEALAGEEMGDWFLARNDAAGLLWSCRDSARQHPKEFSVSDGLVNLKLFSENAGEELDFRSETLAGKWNLVEWFQAARRSWPEERIRAMAENVPSIPSNAVGWAKTHHLALSPAAGTPGPDAAAALSNWHSRPVYALADPHWTWRSRAMGPLHPRDPARFPEAEALVDGALAFFASRVPVFGEWGFMDYWAGPHLSHGGKFPEPRRWRLAYTLRPDAWRVFARSGLREAYDFATATNRAWGDNYLASWGDERRTKGLYTSASGPDRFDSSASLPYYWGDSTVTNISSSTNLGQLLWDYHLTGYRRAADQVRDFAAGLREQLTPGALDRDWRALMTFRVLLQCYGFTWDDSLRQMAYYTADTFEDPEGFVGLTKERPYRSSTYKTRVDVRAIIEAAELLGDPRFERLARRLGGYIWNAFIGRAPISYTNPQGILGSYFWERSRDPAIARALLLKMRWAATRYRADAGDHGIALGAHEAASVFEGIPAMQEVVARSGADRRPVASWVSVRDFENPVDFFFFKPDQDSVRLVLKTPSGPGATVGGPTMEALDPPSGFGTESLGAVHQRSKQGDDMYTLWNAPRDLAELTVRVTPSAPGDHLAIASGNYPLVLHAPGWWVPWPPQDPPVRWYFRVPEESDDPAVFFEGAARLYDPEGAPGPAVGDAPGWVNLPAGRPGLWSFEVLEPRLVRVRNLPPFFAGENPEAWFDPAIEWTQEEEAAPFEPPAETGFTDGVSGRPGEQALFISSTGSFSFEGGEPLPGEGEGTGFLPFREGTIEFWIRPEWDSFEITDRRLSQLRLLRMDTDRNSWDLFHRMNYSVGGLNLHNLYASAFAERDGQRGHFPTWRRNTIFERGRWVHLALTWGARPRPTASGPREMLFFTIYIDGSSGSTQHYGHVRQGWQPADMPTRLALPGLGAAIDHLRVSDVIRYRENFTPSRQAPEPDGHTRAYFSFDGTLEGVSGDGRTVEGTTSP